MGKHYGELLWRQATRRLCAAAQVGCGSASVNNVWSTMQGFLEWMVLDRADQPDVVFGQEHRLRSGVQLKSAQSWARERGYKFPANGCTVTGKRITETSSGVGILTSCHIASIEHPPKKNEFDTSKLFFQRVMLGSMQ
eukprot:3199815-Pyramimonas_sp.AAC.1